MTSARVLAQFRRAKALVAVLMLCVMLIGQTMASVQALITISGSTTWTDPAPLNDSLTITSSGILRIVNSGGINGGNFVLNLPNGGSLIVNTGGLINLSGVSGNGNGGNFTVNLSGTTGNVTVGGIIRSNGLGSGTGGTILLNSSNFTLSSGALIEALGGSSSGLGGNVTLKQKAGSGILLIPNGVTIQSNGVSSATKNLVTIDADGVEIDGQIKANGIANSAGGKLVLIANDGRVRLTSRGDIYAQGSGTGGGGTIELRPHIAGQTLQVSSCNSNAQCNDSGDLIKIHKSARIRVDGGTGQGTILLGRSATGNISQDMNLFKDNQFVGAGQVTFGSAGNTTDITVYNYNQSTDFSGNNPMINMVATGNITATSNNNFSSVTATSTTGNIQITDTTGGMTASVMDTTGTSTVKALGGGALAITDSTVAGSVILQSDSTVTATTNNAIVGGVSVYGTAGTAANAAAVSIANSASLTVNRLNSTGNVALTTTGAASDMTLSNLNITGTAALNAGRDITASATSNTFGSTISGSGRNMNLYNNAGSTVVNGLTSTGTMTLATISGSSLSLSNVNATGSATISTGGGAADITGSTGNVFKSAASFATNDAAGGNINLSADFQGATSLSGALITVTDTAGDFLVSNVNAGLTNSTLTASAVNSNADVSISNIVNGAGKLTVTANKNIIARRTGGYTTNADTLVLNSTNAGNITLDDYVMTGTGLGITARTATQTGPSNGVWMGTNGGSVTLNNVSLDGAVDLQTKNTISGTGNTFNGTTLMDANLGTAYAISMLNSNFVSTSQNIFDGSNITLSDNSGILQVTNLTATGTASLSATGVNGDLDIDNATVTGNTTLSAARNITANSGNAFGTLTVTGNGTIDIYESGTMNINTVTNNSATGATTLYSTNASVLGKGTAVADIISLGTGQVAVAAGSTATDSAAYVNLNVNTGGPMYALSTGKSGAGTSVRVVGTVGGNLTTAGFYAPTVSVIAATGNLILGDYTTGLNVGGTTTFIGETTTDVTGAGRYTGAVSGNGNRIGIEATSGNFTSGGLTATGATGWYGAADETMIIQTRIGDILGSGYTTTGAGNIRLQAGAFNYLNASNDINVTNVSAAQNLALYATGDTSGVGTGTAIKVAGTSKVTGHITATGITSSNTRTALNGAVDIALSTGNLTTASIVSNKGDITLKASAGSILQDATVYADVNGKTIRAKGGDVYLTAQGASTSNVNTGVLILGSGNDLTVKVSGDSAGNGSGTSAQIYGRVDGNVAVTNTTGNSTTGHIYLGTSLGNLALLDDVNTVMDVVGTTTVKSLKDVKLYGSFGGPVSVISRSVVGQVDKGNLKISQLSTSLTSGMAVNLSALNGSITGSGLTSAGTSAVNLSAGTSWPMDKKSYIDLSGVNIGGNVTATVAGTSTGTSSGNALKLTGSIGGTVTVTNELGGTARGVVTTP